MAGSDPFSRGEESAAGMIGVGTLEVSDVAFIADLSTEAYFAHGDSVRAVGWLESGHPYTQGDVPAEFLAALKKHVETAHVVVLFMGLHDCSLCPAGRRTAGLGNLLVPTSDRLYVAPELITHYIQDHGYRPPDEFVAAVLACPEQGSATFLELLRPFESTWRG